MLKARRIVLILGVLAVLYLLAQFYFFYSCPIGVMCSGNKSELSLRIIMVVAATGLAYWLLKPSIKTPEPEAPGSAQTPPVESASAQPEAEAPTQSDQPQADSSPKI